jgi:hypothetical protein
MKAISAKLKKRMNRLIRKAGWIPYEDILPLLRASNPTCKCNHCNAVNEFLKGK